MKWYSPIHLAVASILLTVSCIQEPSELPPPAQEDSRNLNQEEIKETPPEDDLSYYKLKSNKLLSRDISRALGMSEAELCKDQKTRDCLSDIHKVALKGLAPYKGSIFESKEISSRSAISMERVALISCRNRMEKDETLGDKAIFLNSNKNLMIENAFKKILTRLPSENETRMLLGLYDETMKSSEKPLQDWGTLLCFSLISSTEFLFY